MMVAPLPLERWIPSGAPHRNCILRSSNNIFTVLLQLIESGAEVKFMLNPRKLEETVQLHEEKLPSAAELTSRVTADPWTLPVWHMLTVGLLVAHCWHEAPETLEFNLKKRNQLIAWCKRGFYWAISIKQLCSCMDWYLQCCVYKYVEHRHVLCDVLQL